MLSEVGGKVNRSNTPELRPSVPSVRGVGIALENPEP